MEQLKTFGEGWSVALGVKGFVFKAPSKDAAYIALDEECGSLANTAARWNYEATWIVYPKCPRPIKIPAILSTQEFFAMPQAIRYANVEIPYELIRYVGEMAESDSRQGLVRISDNRQIIMSKHCQIFAPNLETAVQLNRSQYWLLSDLAEFETGWRRTLNDDGSNWFEFTYHVFEPDHPENRESWRKMTSRYRLVTDNLGTAYHVGECLDVVECSPTF